MNKEQGYLLIVEDTPDILNLLETTLNLKGYRVITATNGNEGLEAIQKERPLIVIADIMMPKLDGFGFVHRLRINPETRDIPVVFITATYISLGDKEFAANIGATRFIQKPFDLARFLKTVEEILEQGTHVIAFDLPNELKFYVGYRERLEAKLEQKKAQIERDELLLETQPDQGDLSLQVSLQKATSEREELEYLLEEIYKQLEKIN